MDKPLYILIFLLLWSNRIRGGEEEDINGSFSPSTQKTGVRNSLIDKASTSTVTKKTTIFDPDSESAEKVSPSIKSKTLDTNTGTVEPSVPNSNTPIPAKESTRKNTTTLSDTDSDSSETQSPSNKPEVPKTTNDSSETNLPPIKSEETETKPDAPEIFIPNSVTIKPARDSITVKTRESDPDSELPETDSTSIKSEAPESEFEPPETDSTSIKSEAPDTEFGKQQPSFHNFESHELADESSETNTPPFISAAPEINPASTAKAQTATISDPNSVDLRRFPRSSDEERDINERSNTNTVSAEMENPRSTRDIKRRISKSPKVGRKAIELPETDSTSIKSEAPESEFEPSETDSTSIKSEALETVIGTQQPSFHNFESHELADESSETDSSPFKSVAPEINPDNPDPSISNSETLGPSKELLDTEFPPYISEATESRTEKSDRELPPRHTRTSRATKESSKTNSPPNQRNAAKDTESEDPQSTTNIEEDISTTVISTMELTTTGITKMTDKTTTMDGPNGPVCSKFNQTKPTITNATINLKINFTSNNLCANVTSMQNESDWRFVESEFIGGLSAATSYKILLFQYVDSSDGTLLSAENCSLGTFHTLPEDPDCHVIPNKDFVMNRTSENITLNTSSLTNLSKKVHLCVQIHPKHSKCKPVGQTTMFENLQSSSRYNFSVFSYYNVSENDLMVLSGKNCSLGNYYTLPKNPNCEGITQHITVKDRTSTSITLDFTNLAEKTRESLCVNIQSSETYRPYLNSTMKFERLETSRKYNFCVFLCFNDTNNNKFVLSQIPCNISNYTGPDIPVCNSSLVSEKTTTSMLLDLRNLRTSGAQRYIAEIFDKKNESNKIDHCNISINASKNITNLTAGTAYTLQIFAVSEHNIRSTDSCQVESVYTYPSQPKKPERYYKKDENGLTFSWGPPNGKVDNYTLTVQCHCSCCSCSQNYTTQVPSDILTEKITGLEPGTYCSVNITAISGGLSSIPLQYSNLETDEIAPAEVLGVNVTDIESSGFTISWSKPSKPNGDLINYNVNLSTPERTKNVSISSPSTSFVELKPGTCYNVTIAAVNKISEGEKISTIVYTTETVPSNVTNLVTSNTSSTSIAVTWSKPQSPNGVVRGYQLFVWKRNEQGKSNSLKKIITLKCEDCKIPCPNASRHDNLQNSSPLYVNKEKDEKTTVHTVSFPESNTTLHYEVTGLEIFTLYSFNVTAFTSVGHGNWTTNVKRTSEDIPPSVTDLTSWNTSSTSIAVTWSKPDKPNGVIREYQIFVKKTNEQWNNTRQIITLKCDCCQVPCPTTVLQDRGKYEKTAVLEVPFTEGNTTLHYEVTGLEIFTSYSFNVTAFTSVGHGEWTTNEKRTSEDIPSNVTDLTSSNTSSTSIAVTWSKPDDPNGVIKMYKIFVKKTNEEEGNNLKQIITLKCDCCQGLCPSAVPEDKLQELGPPDENKGKDETTTVHEVSFPESNTTLQYEVTGLEIFTSYCFNVTAFTSVGHGKWAKIVGNTSEDKPFPPGHPVESNVQITNLSFVYDKPEKENGVITNQEIELTYRPYNVCSSERFFTQKVVIMEFPIQTKENRYLATLKNLKPYWIYTIRVRVSTYAGYSDYSKNANIQTRPTIPDRVSDITAVQNTSRHIKIRWTQPCHPNGLIINYKIEVKNVTVTDPPNSWNDTIFTNNNSTSVNVTDLLPYQSYKFTVRTQVEGVLQLSDPQNSTFNTSTEAPYPLENVTVDITSTSVNVSWNPPGLKTGPTNYRVTAKDNETKKQIGSCTTQGFHNTSCSIDKLDAYWPYSLVVYVKVEDFPEKNITTDIRTKQSAPGKVSNFTVTQDPNVTAKTNVHIKWSPPVKRDLNGVIQKYFIQYWYPPNEKMILPFDNGTTQTSVFVKAEKTYTFQIFARTIYNATEASFVNRSITINPGAPLPPQKQKVPLINKGPPASDDQTQIAVGFSQAALCNNSNGKINKWYIIVSKKPGVKVFRGARKDYLKKIENTYKKWEDVYEKDVNIPYIASDSWNPHCESGSRRKRSAPVETISYTLGSDGDCESGNRKYCNGNLEPGQTYRVRYAVCTAGGCLESEFSEPFQTAPNHVPAIAGSLTAVVLVLVVIIVVIIILKRRGKGPFKSLDNGEVGQQNEAFNGVEMKGTSKPKAVKIADFANYVQKLHADSNLLFSSEYKLLKETCPTHTTKAAEVQVNRIKNRYTNILSYDHSRVKLLPTEDDEGSDYINANYMPGYSSPREYIATQGPLPFTRDDFWRMIWEQNVSIIVMLTQLVERGRRKCDIYWPEAAREPVYYGDLVVELESESTLPDYVLRVMSIKLGDTRKTVKQFAYLAWPDMGIPETSEAMLKFAKEVRSHLPPPATSKGPMVVHCSAGVGRTGTFIAVDYLMQHVRTSDVIDIYSYVMNMRNNRPNMVQTEDQYVFIHDCIKDYVNKNDDDTDDEEEEEEKQEDQSIYMNV